MKPEEALRARNHAVGYLRKQNLENVSRKAFWQVPDCPERSENNKSTILKLFIRPSSMPNLLTLNVTSSTTIKQVKQIIFKQLGSTMKQHHYSQMMLFNGNRLVDDDMSLEHCNITNLSILDHHFVRVPRLTRFLRKVACSSNMH